MGLSYIEYFKGKPLLNVGSVGNPLEVNEASYAIIEGKYDSKEISTITTAIIRVPYDINKAIYEAKISGMPDIDEYVEELRYAVYRGLAK